MAMFVTIAGVVPGAQFCHDSILGADDMEGLDGGDSQ